MSELRKLAEFAVDFKLSDVSENIKQAACRCVLDTIGSALGGSGHEEIPSLYEEMEKWAGGCGEYAVSVWGYGKKMGIFPALLLNGMMSHALELDDVHTGSKSHVGAVVVPAAWGMAEALGSKGSSFLEAVIVGYEVMARVGMAMDVASNRKRGWHTTGVIGTFGAAAAAGHLLKLNSDQMVSALGMAGTQASGLWAFLKEGSTCKKLHPGRAAVNGVMAAILAEGGMTGPEHILDAEDGGLYKAISDHYNMEVLTHDLGVTYEILNIDKKPYPCCRTTHHAIDAALALQKKVFYQNIDCIQVDTYDIGVLQCGFSNYPKSCVEAKFSIPFTVAAALVKGQVTQKEFSDQVLHDKEVIRLAEHTKVVSDPLFTERYPKRWGSRMTITLKDGSNIVRQIDDMSGSVNNPMTEEQEISKFKGLAELNLKSSAAERLCDRILNMESQDSLPEL